MESSAIELTYIEGEKLCKWTKVNWAKFKALVKDRKVEFNLQ